MQTIKNTYSILLSKAKAEPRLVGALAAGAALGLVAIGRLVAASRCTWPIEGKVVLITGASSGIGKALALELVRRGASYADSIVATSNLSLIGNFCVSLTARRTAELNAVVEECNAIRAGSAYGIVTDVSVRVMNQRAVDATLHEFGRLDVLILNAGISAGAPFEQVTEEGLNAFEQVTRTNYLGPVYATKYALPELIRNQGRIIVTSSVFGLHGGPGMSFYAGSKFALHGFFESLRFDLAPKNVKVTMICPGPVATEIGNTRVGPDGNKPVTGHFGKDQAMPAEEAAQLIIRALERGERLTTFSLGVSLLYRFQHFVPAFWDWLFLRGMRALRMLDPQ